TAGTGGGHGVVRALQSQMDGQVAGRHVDDRAGHEERRNAPRALLVQSLAVVLDVGQAANAGADGHANALPVGVADLQAGIAQRLDAGRDGVLDEQVQLAGVLGWQVLLDIKTAYRAADPSGKGGKVEMLDGGNATAPRQDPFPTAGNIHAQRREHAHSGDYNASARHSNLLSINWL